MTILSFKANGYVFFPNELPEARSPLLPKLCLAD